MEMNRLLDLYRARQAERGPKLDQFFRGERKYLLIQRPPGEMWGACNSIEQIYANMGAATGAEMREAGASRQSILKTMLALTIPPIAGVLGGGLLFSGVSREVVVVVLSFAAAALLYLVTEELLVEAHEVPETPFTTAMFFAGFIILYVLELAF